MIPQSPPADLSLAYLSKSGFKVGRECPAKLWYRSQRYPTTRDEDAFMQYLAESGHLVGKIAQMRYPEGCLIDSLDLEVAERQTRKLLEQESVILFEPVMRHGNLLARVDVLIKEGSACQLIEVKARKAPACFLSKKGDKVLSDWLPYIEDVAFQLQVAQDAFPQLTFHPFLLLTDGSAKCRSTNLPGRFDVRTEGRQCEVTFNGSEAERKELIQLLSLHPVATEVAMVRDEVRESSKALARLVEPNAPHPRPSLSAACRKCEYRVEESTEPSGFLECWGRLAAPNPHIFDLYKGDLLKGGRNRVLNHMIAEGRTSLFDVRDEEWADTDKPYRQRQAIQIEYTRRNEEWIDPKLGPLLKSAPYPLQFIDFEFDQSGIPIVPGTAPWNRIAFQWSLHRIASRGAELEHMEFLDTDSADPHPAFLTSLQAAIDLQGTVLVWSSAEAATLRNLVTGRNTDTHQQWIDALLATDGPIIDMEKWVIRHHFHPDMKNQTSIKKVFPPAWQACTAVVQLPACRHYLEYDSGGRRRDPYALLAERHPDFPVADGTAAIIAYHQLFSNNLSPKTASRIRQQLLDYCRLDTLAMVVVWLRWEEVLIQQLKQ
jgi:hypothetical protein